MSHRPFESIVISARRLVERLVGKGGPEKGEKKKAWNGHCIWSHGKPLQTCNHADGHPVSFMCVLTYCTCMTKTKKKRY